MERIIYNLSTFVFLIFKYLLIISILFPYFQIMVKLRTTIKLNLLIILNYYIIIKIVNLNQEQIISHLKKWKY